MDDCQGCPGCRSDNALARANKWEKGQDGLMSTAKELLMRCSVRSGGLTSFGEIMQALVLAGGRSSRMGRDKSLIQIDGKSLIRITLERLIDSGHSAILVMASDEVQESRQKSSAGNSS